MKRSPRMTLALLLLLAAGGGAYVYAHRGPATLTLTGIVTTNDVIVSPQIGGRIGRLLVNEGDRVEKDQLIATIEPEELETEKAYYAQNQEGLASQVRQSEAALRFQERQLGDQIAQAESTLAASEAQAQAAKADLEAARLTFARTRDLAQQGIASAQELDQARAVADAAQAKLEALARQVEAQRSAVGMARSNAEQVMVRRSEVQASQHLQAAAAAQRAKADVRLGYAEIRAPVPGQVDVRAVRPGEYVGVGQPIATLVNPDALWVRADVEETYIDRVRLPSGGERLGTVFYRGLDAAYATQRDVSRTKRDIKTFEVRLRLDNRDRRLAVGMTAYVSLPVR